MYLVFDTETTGRINKEATFKPLNGFPHLVQIAWQNYSCGGELLNSESYIIKPEGFTIPKEAEEIHGISTKKALKEGRDSREIMERFNNNLNKSDYLIAHNFRFDSKIVMAESIRTGHFCNVFSKDKTIIDTMLKYKHMSKEKFKNGTLKFPKLRDLYFTVFGEHFEGEHDALADVEACAKIYFKLK